jgi:integrase
VGRIVAELAAAAGIAPAHGVNQLGPHDLRRTAARNAYDNGATVLQVQAMLGHADASTTSRYIGALDADKSAVDKIEY